MYFTRNYLIGLDKKGRLVLPLEIRESLGIETNGKIVISISAAKDGKVILELKKASDSDIANGISNKQQLLERQKSGDFWISFSKNGKYLRGD